MNYSDLLEHSYKKYDSESSRLEFLADHVFNFTTYDSDMSELFAQKAIEVCKAINTRSVPDFISDIECYKWYLIMVNLPFFSDALNWGTSIRGAWWEVETKTLISCGLYHLDVQILRLEFTLKSWEQFINAVITFSSKNS